MIVKILTGVLASASLAGALVIANLVPIGVPGAIQVEHREVTPLAHPAACPGPLEVPVGDISSGDAGLGSASDDVRFDMFAADTPRDVGAGASSEATAAATLERVGSGDLAGLAAISCVRPEFDQWLVGGATTLGSSARLVLTNPSDAPVEANITAYGALGVIGEPFVMVVGPQAQQSLLLEGVIPGNPALVLHIQATGTGVVAAVQDSRLDGFTPAGTDWVGVSAAPATHVVIPAVGPSVPDTAGATAYLTLMAPEGATVDLTLVTEAGIAPWSGTAGLTISPGVVTEIPVPAIGAGAIEIRADSKVVAAAISRVGRKSQIGQPGSVAFDTMWVAGQQASSAPRSVVAVTDSPVLSVYSATHQRVVVTNKQGEQVAAQDVPARTVQRLSVDAAAGDVLTIAAEVSWVELVTGDDNFVSALAPVSTTVPDLDVAVRVDSYIPVP